MNAASILRLILYIVGAGLSGSVALQGFATFDPVTWQLDILPFDVKAAITALFTLFTNALAALAVWRGWGRK